MATCECLIHRYHIAHICGCGKLISHSQAEMDEHRTHEGEWRDFNPAVYEHGDEAGDIMQKLDALEEQPVMIGYYINISYCDERSPQSIWAQEEELADYLPAPAAELIKMGYSWLKFNSEEKAFDVSPIVDERG